MIGGVGTRSRGARPREDRGPPPIWVDIRERTVYIETEPERKRACVPRPKEYDRDEVLDTATRLFWGMGYTGTSVNALVESTGLGKRSMYEEFGNKEQLFQACLQNYISELNKEANTILTRQPLGLDNIEAFFLNRIDYAASADCNGCMVINAAIEKELIDGDAFRIVLEALSGHEEAFFLCLEAARERGQIPAGKDHRALARYLMTFSAGLMVMCKTEPKRAALAASVEAALSVLKS